MSCCVAAGRAGTVSCLAAGALLLVTACRGERAEGPLAEAVAARSQGLAFLQQDRLEEAEAEFRRLVRLAPADAAGYASLAQVHLRRGELAAAGERAREALERAPEDPELRQLVARVHEEAGRTREARRELERALTAEPGHLKALWALARLEAGEAATGGPGADAASRRRLALLRRILERAPGSAAARLELVEGLLREGRADSAVAHLEELRSLSPEWPEEAVAHFGRAVDRARASDGDGALEAVARLRELLETTGPYQADLQRLEGPPGEAAGFLHLSFSHQVSLRVPDEAAVLEALRFTDATAFARLDALGEGVSGDRAAAGRGSVAAVADYDGDGHEDLFVWIPAGSPGEGAGFLLRNELGRFVDATPEGLRDVGNVTAAVWADYDNDGRPDLYLVRDGPNRLFRNLGDGRFQEVAGAAGVADPGRGLAAVFVDADHDGDLDLLVANDGPDRFYRNNLDGTFTEAGAAVGLRGGTVASRAVVFADFDGDADIDLAVARGERGVALYDNRRENGFVEVAAERGLGGVGRVVALAAGDYDNDGLPDLLVVGPPGSGGRPGEDAGGRRSVSPAADSHVRLFRNGADGRAGFFRRDRRSDAAFALLDGLEVRDAAFLDFDNDGHLDIVVVGRPPAPEARGVFLFRNDGSGAFRDASEKLPSVGGAAGAELFDYNEDGDLDLLLASHGRGVRLLRNDGGNENHHLQIRLMGRGAGSGKVNRFGVGARLDVRAGDLFQSRTVTGPLVHFGLGRRLKADVVRVVWTNGVPQHLYFPGTDEELIEEQTLKGSCAFVYAWDGERYSFVTDAMWRSALGMPLGIMGGGRRVGSTGRVYAPPGPSREYVRIPGSVLRPAAGVYRIKLTEELWEVAYVDEVRLLAVDHPDSVEVFVDERFVPPAAPEFRLYAVSRKRTPRAATDGWGNDLLPALRERDDVYASTLAPGRYQGIAEMHDLVLDLGPAAARADRVFLFLRGWIFPTDASINVALAQSSATEPVPPLLQLPDGAGGWRTAAELGFPAGKDKTVAADLTGLLPPDDPRVRIRTNLQVHWDHVFFTAGPAVALRARGTPEEAVRALQGADATLRFSVLEPTRARLDYRGFSREYRKGGRHGPHWFDPEDVSPEPRWLPIPGRYTRYGDVLPLLREPDDMYVIMAPGDALTVEFDAAQASDPPPGWRRTFLLYTDGWIKDADLNTATGESVEPLPFRAQSRYPYGPEEAFPWSQARRRWDSLYNTRRVAREAPSALDPPPTGG